MPSRLRQEISKAFKLHGYTLKVEASKHLEELLTPLPDPNHWIETILDTLSRKDLQSAVLDKAVLDKVIKVLYIFVILIVTMKDLFFMKEGFFSSNKRGILCGRGLSEIISMLLSM